MPSLASNRPTATDQGTSLVFSKLNTQKAYETAETAAYRSGPLTAMAWVRVIPPTGTANQMTVLAKGKQSTSNLCWSLAVNFAGTLRAEVSSAGNNSTAVTSTVLVTPNVWHHVALVYNPAATSLTAYLDGVSVATSGAAPATLFASTMPVTIGATSTAVGTIQFPFSGFIQDAAVITTALTAGQIQAVMAAGAAGILAPIGGTHSVWINGEDVGINTSATDFGNTANALTLSGTSADWYGQKRPRMAYSLNALGMNAALEFSTIVTDATNGWNAVARGSDILLVPAGFQSLVASTAVARGILIAAYTWFDPANNSPGGSGLTIKDDLTAGIPGITYTGGVAIVGYDNEVWNNTPPAENDLAHCDAAAKYVHAAGYKFALVPSLGLASTIGVANLAAIVDNNGKPGIDYYVIQSQTHDGSVDDYCANIFPVLKALHTTQPSIKIYIQVQNFKTGTTKIADQFDLVQCIWNAHSYLQSIGRTSGLDGWGFFIAPGSAAGLMSNWGDVRRMLRPSGRAAATRRALFFGQVTSATNNTLTDNLQNGVWTTNQWAGRTVYITGGLGDTQSAVIVSNTSAGVLTITGTWTTNPNGTSSYQIV